MLYPNYKYRAGSEFDEFLEINRSNFFLNVKYYLLKDEVLKNKGNHEIRAIDANRYESNEYKLVVLRVNESLRRKIESNILYIRTVDSGSMNGRVGLGVINEDFKVQGIYVSGNTYRTHPIHIFLEPEISLEDQVLLRKYFNHLLEHFRKKLDSEFLTTYKYSKANYTRKYLGLTQTRKLIETFPILEMEEKEKKEFINSINEVSFENILRIMKKTKQSSFR